MARYQLCIIIIIIIIIISFLILAYPISSMLMMHNCI